MRRSSIVIAVCLLLMTLLLPVQAAESFPETLPLPDGFQPEGIAIGPGTTFYVGSIPTGAIFRGDLRTGEGEVFVQPVEGRAAIGLGLGKGSRMLYVAGGPTGQGYVYDARTGAEVAVFQLTDQETFINDVVVTDDAAYFTDSSQPVIYRVPVGPDGAPGSEVETIELGGDFEFVPDAFNLNGIDATRKGDMLIVVSSALGALFTVDPTTGDASRIDLGDEVLTNGDGILLDGRTLYVVQNQLNQIAVVRLSRDLSSGEVLTQISDTDFRVPTTIAEHGNRLYAVNARFGTTPEPTTDYDVVQVRKR